MNGKEISWKMHAGVFVTISGCITAVLFAPSSQDSFCDVSDLENLFKNIIWQGYMLGAVASCIGLGMIFKYYDKMETAGTPLPNSTIIKVTSYSILAAVGFGTPQMVAGKMIGFLTSMSIFHGESDQPDCKDPDVFQSWFPYVVIIAFLLLTSQWLVKMNNGLMLFQPLVFVPIVQGNFILWGIVSAGICFQEFNNMQSSFSFIQLSEGVTWVGFIGGVMIMFYGLYLICSDQETGTDDLDESGRRTDLERQTSELQARTASGRFNLVHQKSTINAPRANVTNITRFVTSPAAQLTEHQNLSKKVKLQEKLIRDMASRKTISVAEASRIKEMMIASVSARRESGTEGADETKIIEEDGIRVHSQVTPRALHASTL